MWRYVAINIYPVPSTVPGTRVMHISKSHNFSLEYKNGIAISLGLSEHVKGLATLIL